MNMYQGKDKEFKLNNKQKLLECKDITMKGLPIQVVLYEEKVDFTDGTTKTYVRVRAKVRYPKFDAYDIRLGWVREKLLLK